MAEVWFKMAIVKQIQEDTITWASQIRFGGHDEPMLINYHNNFKGDRGSVRITKTTILEVLTEEELVNLQSKLQRLADHFNPDREENEIL